MTESDLQTLLQNQTDNSIASTLDPSSMLTSAFEPLIPYFIALSLVAIVITIIIVTFFVINIIQKQRQHAAIMRIDKNLQKLIDAKGLSDQDALIEPTEPPSPVPSPPAAN